MEAIIASDRGARRRAPVLVWVNDWESLNPAEQQQITAARNRAKSRVAAERARRHRSGIEKARSAERERVVRKRKNRRERRRGARSITWPGAKHHRKWGVGPPTTSARSVVIVTLDCGCRVEVELVASGPVAQIVASCPEAVRLHEDRQRRLAQWETITSALGYRASTSIAARQARVDRDDARHLDEEHSIGRAIAVARERRLNAGRLTAAADAAARVRIEPVDWSARRKIRRFGALVLLVGVLLTIIAVPVAGAFAPGRTFGAAVAVVALAVSTVCWVLIRAKSRQLRADVTRALEAHQQAALAELADARLDERGIPGWLRRAVLERDRDQCVECRATDSLHIDHVYPWSKLGPTTYENLQTLCEQCNRRKGDSITPAAAELLLSGKISLRRDVKDA